MRNKIFFITSLMLIAVVLTACGSTALAQTATPTDKEQPRTISVSGTGKSYLTPDIAYINIGVHTEGKDAAEVVASNNSQTQKVVDALTAEGVDKKDIQTTNFSIYPQQQYDTQGKPTGEITYIVDNTVFVTLRDISKIGHILGAVVQAGANSINGIQFDLDDKTAAMSQARQQAVKDAQAKAQELATAAGVTLGEVQTISEYGGAAVPVFQGKGGGGVMMAEAANVPVSPGQMILQVDVNIVYNIK